MRREKERRDRWEFEREKEKSAWDLLALKLFHLMVLRGIDGRREGAQKSIKSEKGEIKSSPSPHLLKWVHSLFLSPLCFLSLFSNIDNPVRALIISSLFPTFTFIYSFLILTPCMCLCLSFCIPPPTHSIPFYLLSSFLICVQTFLTVALIAN